MINEYALDPRTIKSWQDARYLLEKFGFHNGRMICRLPKGKQSRITWEQMVLASVSPPREKSRVAEKLYIIKKTHFIERELTYDDSKEWLFNVQVEHLKSEFKAIISVENPSKDQYVIVYNDDFDDTHERIKVDLSKKIVRKAKEMANSIAVLLNISKNILFVDPRFVNLEQRHINPFIEFLNTIYSRKVSVPITKIEYHTGERTDSIFCNDVNSKICSNIPSNYSFDIVMWPQAIIHNRYVLTNIGGVEFGIGLDENVNTLKSDDVITNLGIDAYTKELEFYSNNKSLKRINFTGKK